MLPRSVSRVSPLPRDPVAPSLSRHLKAGWSKGRSFVVRQAHHSGLYRLTINALEQGSRALKRPRYAGMRRMALGAKEDIPVIYSLLNWGVSFLFSLTIPVISCHGLLFFTTLVASGPLRSYFKSGGPPRLSFPRRRESTTRSNCDRAFGGHRGI